MTYYTDLFSPDTYERFERSDRTVTGFKQRQLVSAQRVKPGDKFVCYMTKLSRWVGVLEVTSDLFTDDTPKFADDHDSYVLCFKVRELAWLPLERTVPIHEKVVWDSLSFTRECAAPSSVWTAKVRTSLNRLSAEDGQFLEQLLVSQQQAGNSYPVDLDYFRGLIAKRIRRSDKSVAVTVPQGDELSTNETSEAFDSEIRESTTMQALLAKCGEKMGFRIWLPKADRLAVLRCWQPEQGSLIDVLPLNYDETTLRTIEQIDVLWLKGRSIARAFEVEQTTAIYSGLLRMADLLALQPNMDIRLHIVAPEARREKVFTEIRRPVFSLLDKGPLSESCTYISYDSIRDLSQQKHLDHLSDSVLSAYEEEPE